MHSTVSRRDDGAVAILVAGASAMLFLIGAFAVDFGIAYNEKRSDQNTADSGALSGAGSLPADRSAATAAVKQYVNDNLEPDVTEAEWATCTDTLHLAVTSPSTQCISFSRFNGRIRVLIPIRHVRTVLASAVGFSDIKVNASAEAAVIQEGFGAGVLPFGLPSGGTSSSEVCLKTGSQPDLPPCNGPTTGNFGTLDFSWYGNPVTGTPTECTGQTQTRLVFNIILGVDHALDVYNDPDSTPPESGDTIRNERASCSDPQAYPNQADGQTGLGSNLDRGLVTGSVLGERSFLGRLARYPSGWPDKDVRREVHRLDDRPLWDYIDPLLTTGIPAECQRSAITNKAEMVACLDAYKTGGYTTPLFTVDSDPSTPVVDIQQSPRFAYVPELWQAAWTNGVSSPYEFKRFRPVFIQTLYFRCSSGHGCDGIFDPGEPGSGLPANKNDQTEAMTALQIPPSALPSVVTTTAPGTFRGDSRIVLTH